MSDPAIHENPSPGIPPDEQDLRFDYFWDFASFFNKDSDDTFEIHAESVPSASTISGGLVRPERHEVQTGINSGLSRVRTITQRVTVVFRRGLDPEGQLSASESTRMIW
ncbi:hypothetical protein EDD18DRAFT_1361838 [Armillaria luteobubalina]|uniref:Uncharacterized protein n=1 Tax=Armillaria luteobubalina TaxID=153913 RepID=A0AA39UCF8_9AGAR|nr:hypothetical protein EDD18DRAFT_1361838 [Armillaria luteobubalina]